MSGRLLHWRAGPAVWTWLDSAVALCYVPSRARKVQGLAGRSIQDSRSPKAPILAC
jgi:hypothetical protein